MPKREENAITRNRVTVFKAWFIRQSLVWWDWTFMLASRLL